MLMGLPQWMAKFEWPICDVRKAHAFLRCFITATLERWNARVAVFTVARRAKAPRKAGENIFLYRVVEREKVCAHVRFLLFGICIHSRSSAANPSLRLRDCAVQSVLVAALRPRCVHLWLFPLRPSAALCGSIAGPLLPVSNGPFSPFDSAHPCHQVIRGSFRSRHHLSVP